MAYQAFPDMLVVTIVSGEHFFDYRTHAFCPIHSLRYVVMPDGHESACTRALQVDSCGGVECKVSLEFPLMEYRPGMRVRFEAYEVVSGAPHSQEPLIGGNIVVLPAPYEMRTGMMVEISFISTEGEIVGKGKVVLRAETSMIPDVTIPARVQPKAGAMRPNEESYQTMPYESEPTMPTRLPAHGRLKAMPAHHALGIVNDPLLTATSTPSARGPQRSTRTHSETKKETAPVTASARPGQEPQKEAKDLSRSSHVPTNPLPPQSKVITPGPGVDVISIGATVLASAAAAYFDHRVFKSVTRRD
ncbi:hypothetical protein AMAG_18933 [Allomyces macrogynus ATCC 38327]|uniref:Uncharacterized protein n=1 Tax=Allomyces macrogynus (strain ATCC 38327) TaxID=578462 RepID=A0A0L0SKA8_ALLM3|nr:hypothetical protein AMAG_18933 [Allomyces macrogynus ATCC 38327]|eukprot:KNE62931.1 hypothetical protein AMAG_18933 [Allomyces macrogynus ATCC 38327]